MNYLAHLLLAGEEAESIAGNLMGDFVKGRVDGLYTPGIRRGIVQHRTIDRFADEHLFFRQSRGRISAEQRRYAGILIDIFYDHFLCRHWSQFSNEPLDDFTRRVYAVLQDYLPLFPPRLQHIVPFMVEQDWLSSYGDTRSVERALTGVGRRLRRDNPLHRAVSELHDSYDDLQTDFLNFFPLLMDYVRRSIISGS